MKKNIKIIFSDIDSTLVIPEKPVSEELKKAVQALKSEGIIFVPITGRPFMGLKDFINELGIETIVAGYNGAYAYDFTENKLIIDNILGAENQKKVIEYFAKEAIDFIAYDEEAKVIYTTNSENQYASLEAKLTKVGLSTKPALELIDVKTHKILGLHDPNTIDGVIEKLYQIVPDMSITKSQPFFIEVNDLNVSKGKTAQAICDYFEIDYDQAIVFGDSLNDQSMFEMFENSVAVANAHEIILNLAKEVTDDVADNGVAKYLQKYILN